VEDNQGKDRAEIYSRRVRAGKRTYFFDVKSTRSNDYYLTITESRRRYKDDGYFYEKHKIFLYKEDFNKFVEALQDTVGHIKEELMPEYDFSQYDNDNQNYDSDNTQFESNGEKKTSIDDELKWD
jgi:lipopolysaccharide export LptBFGC system permease protein LptF